MKTVLRTGKLLAAMTLLAMPLSGCLGAGYGATLVAQGLATGAVMGIAADSGGSTQADLDREKERLEQFINHEVAAASRECVTKKANDYIRSFERQGVANPYYRAYRNVREDYVDLGECKKYSSNDPDHQVPA